MRYFQALEVIHIRYFFYPFTIVQPGVYYLTYNNRIIQKAKELSMKKIRVVIWNENVHEKEDNAAGKYIRTFYPEGIHAYLAGALAADDFEITPVSLDMPEQGLPDDLLNNTDVLLWWGHCAHGKVDDTLVDRIQKRVLSGMGLVVLHSGHFSKIFRRLMGTECRLRWREVGEKERLWVVSPSHPIAQGLPETFVIPHQEMYGEPFDIPDDGKIVFMSWFEGGNVFRSGVAFERDRGKIFYFSPGHETYPVYHDCNVQKVLANAIRWSAPVQIVTGRITPQPESLEPITTRNPLADLDTSKLHQ